MAIFQHAVKAFIGSQGMDRHDLPLEFNGNLSACGEGLYRITRNGPT
jgi:hypothetical protein